MQKLKGETSKIFLDSSVLFAAILSPFGGSRRILDESKKQNIELLIIPYILTEVEISLKRKYPEKDIPILAGAKKAGVTHLLTLDKKHILSNENLNKMEGLFEISTPGDYIKKIF